MHDYTGIRPNPFMLGLDVDEINGTLATALLCGKPDEVIVLPDSRVSVDLDGLRKLLFKIFRLTPQQFYDMNPVEQDRISDKLRRIIEKQFRETYPREWAKLANGSYEVESQMRHARGNLHASLVPWSRGKLILEKPQGSSLHHLLEYDRRHTEAHFAQTLGTCQIFVVENDWAKIGFPPGEWRLPFEVCCWEFRITGVRVLAFTDASKDVSYPMLWCVYGRDGHWVVDDYHYILGNDGISSRVFTAPKNTVADNPVEFPAVAKMCFEEIRASCIMMDAKVCHREQHTAPAPLVKRAVKEKRQPPMDYMVVRLRPQSRIVRARSYGAGVGNSRAPQRGHWRRATWVHYDDQDSGEVQYVNDGGFIVSKTWRHWHFAGDPDNILEREYRL